MGKYERQQMKNRGCQINHIIPKISPVLKETIKEWLHWKYKLTSAQSSVFIEAVLGHSNKKIGENLCINEKTVKFHLTDIYFIFGLRKREGVSNRVHLLWVLLPLEQFRKLAKERHNLMHGSDILSNHQLREFDKEKENSFLEDIMVEEIPTEEELNTLPIGEPDREKKVEKSKPTADPNILPTGSHDVVLDQKS